MWDIRRSNQGYLEIKGPLNRKELVPSLRRTPIETIHLPKTPHVTFFDGNLIWVFCRGEVYGFDPDTNEKVTISDDSFANRVEAISCDGNFLWVPYDQNLIFLDKSQHTIDVVGPLAARVLDIVFDGYQMWLTLPQRGTLEVWRVSTRNRVFELSMEESPSYLEFDGKYIWVSANSADSHVVRKINAWNRLIEAEFYFDEIVREMVFDGDFIWVTTVTN